MCEKVCEGELEGIDKRMVWVGDGRRLRCKMSQGSEFYSKKIRVTHIPGQALDQTQTFVSGIDCLTYRGRLYLARHVPVILRKEVA
jgi:hypothetical protein